MSLASSGRRPLTNRVSKKAMLTGTTLATLLLSTSAQAALVSACTGASLPASRLTSVLTPLVTGIFTPLVGIPLIGPGLLNGVSGIVTGAVTGQTISLDVLDFATHAVIDPAAPCATTSDSFQLDTPAGIAIGGNFGVRLLSIYRGSTLPW